MEKKSTLKLTQITMLLAMGIILHYLEPDILITGARFRIGFANIMGIMVLVLYGGKDMLSVNILRVVLASLMKGYIFGSTFWISLVGVLLSTIVTIIIHHYLKSSIIMLSMVGAFFHTLGQIFVVTFYYQTLSVFFLLPYLLLLSLPAGYGTGFIAKHVLGHLGYRGDNHE